MIAAFKSFIAKVFGGNSYFATFFIAMIPLIELKGAIPFGMSEEFFGANKLPPFSAWLAASLGALVPAFLLVAIFVPLIKMLKKTKGLKKLSLAMEAKIKDKAEKVKGKTLFKKYLALVLFVAIPLPLTGAWTGSLIASILGLNYFASILCILIGNLMAGAIVTLLCTILAGQELTILLGFLALVGLILAVHLVQKLVRAKRAKKSKIKIQK